MEEIIINGKALYTPKGAAREYAAVGCNFYTGCPHNCDYCYLKRGAPSKQLGGTEVKLKKCFKNDAHALSVLEKELDANLEHLKTVGIFLSFTTDPLIAETRNLTFETIFRCVTIRDIPVMVLTKNASFIDDAGFIRFLGGISEDERRFIAFGFTLTGRDDMEPLASTNQDRIETMHRLKELGFRTWASIEPIIQFNKSLSVIQESVRFCDHYKIGLRSGVKKDYYDDEDLRQFMWNVNKVFADAEREYMAFPTAYWKESVRKRFDCNILHHKENRFSVEKDYNIFAHD